MKTTDDAVATRGDTGSGKMYPVGSLSGRRVGAAGGWRAGHGRPGRREEGRGRRLQNDRGGKGEEGDARWRVVVFRLVDFLNSTPVVSPPPLLQIRGRAILLSGKPGTGKTAIAMGLAQQLREEEETGRRRGGSLSRHLEERLGDSASDFVGCMQDSATWGDTGSGTMDPVSIVVGTGGRGYIARGW